MLELVDVRTAAQAVKSSENFLRQLAREGKIPSYRLSARKLRFDLSELRQYMKLVAEGRPSDQSQNG